MAKTALVRNPLPAVNLLLVEDDPSDAFLVGNLLGDIGHADFKTLYVGTQAEAVRALAKESFDVCLLDLTLPDANGFSALIHLQEKAPDMPVLILTGVNDTGVAKRAVGRGAQDYLLKNELETAALSRSIDYAIERKRTEKLLFERANHDALTGLANRSMLESRLATALARAERTGGNIALLFIDLDRFKPINDHYGHDAGDEALKTVAKRLKQAIRAYDTAARFGGDEFAVLLEDIATTRDAAIIAQKIIKAIAAPIPYQGKQFSIGASIGIAFTDAPIGGEEFLQHADAAMYHAKKDGGNYRFYSADMQDVAENRLKLEEDLRAALAAGELRLYYQPYVAPDGNEVIGVETLLRWANPERGMLAPQEFLPAAEAGRLMPEIGAWMGGQLAHDIAMWNAEMLPPLEIAVNLSLSQLDAPGITSWFEPLAEAEYTGSHRLAVEIPEEALTSISETRFITLAKLSDMGILLHLDHFGRGALSLQNLHALPFSLLKIDASLIARMSGEVSDDVLIRSAIMLAHHMGMQAGAVGIETPWQMASLKEHACDRMQGFLTARPMTARQLVEWLGQRR